jgi:hypothetical protein
VVDFRGINHQWFDVREILLVGAALHKDFVVTTAPACGVV